MTWNVTFCVDHVQVSLTVDHPQKVLVMGEAQDFGTCKATKKNGDPCSQIVNMVGPSSPAVCSSPWINKSSEVCRCILQPACFCVVVWHSMSASTASFTSRPSIRRWARRGPSCSRRFLEKLPTRWKAAAWESVCVRTASTTAACPHPPAPPHCEWCSIEPFLCPVFYKSSL